MPINTPTGYLDITNATLRGSKIVTTGFVGIANANPTNHLSIGSNLHINDTHSNVLQVSGNINAASVVLGGLSIAPTFDLEIVTNTGNTTPYTVEFNNTATAFVTTANATIGDTLTASKLVGDGSGISAIQSSNVSDFGSNVSRITTLETDLGNNSARITNLSSNLSDNSARITNLSSNLSDNSSRITALETGNMSISGDKTFTGDIIFESNVHMNSGNVFVANTVNMTVSDPIIELGSNNLNTNDLGIIMTRHGDNSNVALVYDEDVDILRMGYTLNGASDSVISLDSNALAVSVQGELAVGSNLEVGTANLFVDTTTSRVGINVASPLQPLNVKGNGQNPVIYMTDGTNNRYASGMGTHNVTNVGQRLDFYTGDSGANDTSLSSSHIRMSIDANGNVGIGKTDPQDLLHIYGASDSTLRVETDTGQAQLLLRAGATTRRACRIDFSRADTGTQYMQIIGDYAQNATDDLTVASSTSGRLMTWLQNGNVGIGTTSPDGILDVDGYKTKFKFEYKYQDYWTSNNNQTFTIPVTGGSARGLMLVEAKVIQVAANSSADRVARVKGMISNYGTGNFYMTVLEGENVSAFETYIVGSSGVASGTFTLKYQPEAGYQQSVVCRLYLKIWFGGYTSSLGALSRTDTGSNSALTAPTWDDAVTSFGGKVGIGTYNPSGEFHVHGENIYLSSKLVSNCTWRIMPQTGNATKIFRIYDQDNAADRLVINSSGNVGIGTTSPDVKLHVEGNPAFDGSTTVRIRCNASQYGRNQLQLIGRYEGNNDAWSATGARNAIRFLYQTSSTSAYTEAWTIQHFQNGSNNDLGFLAWTNTTPMMVLRGQTGRVGIGTSTPVYRLHVSDGNDSVAMFGPNTTWSSYLAVGSGSDKTAANNTAIAQCISTNGNLHLDAGHTRDIYMNHYRGAYIRHGGSGLYSDDRLKSEEELITNATDTLLKLSPQKYLKKRTLREDEDREPVIETGLIAQDIWYDAPELRHIVLLGADADPTENKPEAPVDGDIQQDPDYSSWGPNEASVNYDGLIAYLVKSNQELHGEIQALKARITTLENA